MMTNKKLPRDFVGFVFFVFGWIIGMLLKGLYYTVRFIGRTIYKVFKRDQLNRRLRLAQHKLDCEANAPTRALGREELRHLTAIIGLTNADWHKSVKIRRRILDALQSAGEKAAANGDLSEPEAAAWIEETTRLLFTNFDRQLLTAEKKPDKRRVHRLSKNSFWKTKAENQALTIKEEESKPAPADEKLFGLSSQKKGYETSKLSPLGSLPTISANEWTADDEAREG